MKKASLIIFPAAVLMAAGLYYGYSHFKEQKKAKIEFQKAHLPVFQIEEKIYTLTDFNNYLRALDLGQEKLEAETLNELFTQFIEDRLILYSAKKQGLELTDSEKQAFLRRMVKDYPATNDLSDKLAQDENLMDSLLIEKYKYEKVKEATVSDEEIKQYYQEHKKDFLTPERIRVSQILVKSSDLAVKLLEKLQPASEEEFRQAAREYSEAPDAYKGGVMGTFKPGDLPYDMEKVVFSLEEGKLSQVFQSPYGFHIFRLDKRFPPSLLGLEEAAPKIRNLLLERKVKDIIAKEIEELKATYHWKIFPENLPFKYEGKNDD
ncbi:MAG: peptidyl-prolyl cis-trans isomerase [Candidatus Aminicenantes bacterium]|jgi:parvulin-like peptidyl-prolyl isomerase|nr:peptidyl-prolyl cis-trans isomerase [Candidatus Aminicenantes bacterium]